MRLWYISLMSRLRPGLVFACAVLTPACEPPVDCTALCERLLYCQVTFQASDDPNALKVEAGERTELESCRLGCEAHPRATPKGAQCVGALELGDPGVCQTQSLACLNLDDG